MLLTAWRQAGRRAGQRTTLDTTRSQAVSHARLYWRRFHIDDTGHGDWQGNGTEQELRTIKVRFSVVPESMVDALHALRTIERQFGRIREYRLLRDSEIPSEYQALCWAAFESARSFLRVPPQGATLKVVLPPPLGRPEGGPGLDDLKSLLKPEKRSKSKPSSSQDESPEPVRFMIVSVKRADAPITFRSTLKPPQRSRRMKAAIGHTFLEWGGFAPLKPLNESSPYISPVQDLSPLDSKNMRMALNKWSQIVDVPDPLFPEMCRKQPHGETGTRGEDVVTEWEPLSEPLWIPDMEADAADELDMPQSAQESLKRSLEGILNRSQLHTVPGSTSEKAVDSLTHEEKT